ncbi:MAG: lycopene cyclase family protein [Chitinophagaceae bacterium]
MEADFDYIIAGAGCAGLSLLVHLQEAGLTKGKKILLVDKAPKQGNDRTWCFWETKPGLFESVVAHTWPTVSFFSNRWEGELNIDPYQYKMVRSGAFYAYCMERIAADPAIKVLYAPVTAIYNTPAGMASVVAGGTAFTARYVFNSILMEAPQVTAKEHYLLQHFKGWIIEADKPAFDPGKATLMDFRIGQEEGTTFVYVLPLTETKALVEYTLFTASLLKPEVYDEQLRNYISSFLKLEKYSVAEEEFGVIPMTNFKFPVSEGNIVFTGTAGGQTKASSGYTFRYIQEHSARLVIALRENVHPSAAGGMPARFRFYDSVLLHILRYRTLEGADIFTDLFKNGNAARVLRFLDNKTSFPEDLDIMRRLPTFPFLKAAIKELF